MAIPKNSIHIKDFVIPKARVVASKIDEESKKHPTKPDNNERIRKITLGAEQYKQRVREECTKAIQLMMKNGVKMINLRNLGMDLRNPHTSYQDIRAEVYHYGHHANQNDWTQRNPSFECPRPFIEVQKEFQNLGYYLLDESDPGRSFNIFINLYCVEPVGYQQRKPLWHGLNILPKQREIVANTQNPLPNPVINRPASPVPILVPNCVHSSTDQESDADTEESNE